MRLSLKLVLPLAAIALTVPAAAQRSAPFTVVETGEGFAHLEDALMSVRGQDATVMIAPGTYSECAIQQAGRITFKAARPGSVIFDGGTCEGKAALVLRGAGSVVDGIIFKNMRVYDGNGAGNRQTSEEEGGRGKAGSGIERSHRPLPGR